MRGRNGCKQGDETKIKGAELNRRQEYKSREKWQKCGKTQLKKGRNRWVTKVNGNVAKMMTSDNFLATF